MTPDAHGDRTGAASDRMTIGCPPELVEAIAARAAELVLAAQAAEPNGSPWLSVRDAATYLACSERHLERAIARRALRSSTIGRRRIIHRSDLEDFARAAGEETAPTAPPRRSRRV